MAMDQNNYQNIDNPDGMSQIDLMSQKHGILEMINEIPSDFIFQEMFRVFDLNQIGSISRQDFNYAVKNMDSQIGKLANFNFDQLF